MAVIWINAFSKSRIQDSYTLEYIEKNILCRVQQRITSLFNALLMCVNYSVLYRKHWEIF